MSARGSGTRVRRSRLSPLSTYVDNEILFRTSALRQKVKNLQGDMRLFKNENYTDFYTEPPTLGLDDVLYVEVNMERPLLTDIDSSSNVSTFHFSFGPEIKIYIPEKETLSEIQS